MNNNSQAAFNLIYQNLFLINDEQLNSNWLKPVIQSNNNAITPEKKIISPDLSPIEPVIKSEFISPLKNTTLHMHTEVLIIGENINNGQNTAIINYRNKMLNSINLDPNTNCIVIDLVTYNLKTIQDKSIIQNVVADIKQTINLAKPKAILIFGLIGHNILFYELPRMSLIKIIQENQTRNFENIPVITTYGPIELINFERQLEYRKQAWLDLQKLQQLLLQPS